MNVNYKTPEKLIDSLKYEPNINDLIQEDEFVPKFSNIEDPKSKSINPPTYEINNYIDDVINPNFFDENCFFSNFLKEYINCSVTIDVKQN